MQGIISRYISTRFLLAIVLTFCLLLLLIFLIDFVEILRKSTKYGASSFFSLVLLSLLRLPSFAEVSLPFAVLAGSITSFLLLSRSSELVVIRASGISVWQFVFPAVLVAFLIGLISTTIYNPLAALAKAQAEDLYAETFSRQVSIFGNKAGAGAWLRQNGTDGPSVMNAQGVARKGTLLTGITIFLYDRQNQFSKRFQARRAVLKSGYWQLTHVWVSAPNQEPQFYQTYNLSTFLTPTQVLDFIGSAASISFWSLPQFIENAEIAELPATQFKVQYQLLLSRPLLLISMVLLAATCSIRAFRFGNIQNMVIGGLSAGFLYFIGGEVSRNLGLSGIASPMIAAWAPAIMGCFLTLTVLLYQEDG
ncbi:MAG: LPS export ABC transporter permease LptG [Pseudomonadota bacterium]